MPIYHKWSPPTIGLWGQGREGLLLTRGVSHVTWSWGTPHTLILSLCYEIFCWDCAVVTTLLWFLYFPFSTPTWCSSTGFSPFTKSYSVTDTPLWVLPTSCSSSKESVSWNIWYQDDRGQLWNLTLCSKSLPSPPHAALSHLLCLPDVSLGVELLTSYSE